MQHTKTRPIKTVKSYVKRNRCLTATRREARSALWSTYGLNLTEQPLNFATIFGNNHPIILEIGFGMGDSLLQIATTHQDYNFIGIEVHEPGIGDILRKLQHQPIPNLRIFAEDATTIINQTIPDHSIYRIMLLFPDPWPKNRHTKRRIIQADFVTTIMRKLQVNGQLHIATDSAIYAKHTLQIMQQFPQFTQLNYQTNTLPPTTRPITKFEQRGIKLGNKIFDLFFYASPAPQKTPI